MQIIEKIAALRNEMLASDIDAYIVQGSDPHASEYMANHWAEINWLTGFQGEAGTVVITHNEAKLWTDSRYYIQAEKELQGSGVSLMRASDTNCPSISQWLIQNFRTSTYFCVGVNAEMYSYNDYSQLEKELSDQKILLRNVDLIAPIWQDNRPPIPQSKLVVYENQFAGETTESKIKRMREEMNQYNADAIIISALDEIGWLLNIRGADVDYTPCLISYVVLQKNKCTLFIDNNKLDDAGITYLQKNNIEVRPYVSVYSYLESLQGKTILFDGNRTNYALVQSAVSNNQIINHSPSPVLVAMSVKNDVEIAGVRSAMLRDGVALTSFFKWLEEQVRITENNSTTDSIAGLKEIELSHKLHTFRTREKNFKEESFCTIAAVGENGAIVHYHADENDSADIKLNNVLLLDSGGQYLDGTTDITRTVWLGNNVSLIPNQLKRDFTLVLKGHIALARAVFPVGTRGNQLDVLAHQFMWQEGITYGHGTGHGVGHYMGCHEGPQNIRTDNNPNPLRCGNICSDEPGIYREGKYGIRTENLVLVVEDEPKPHTTGEKYFRFETLTLCFYDTRLIDKTMLTDDEKKWINEYHSHVYNKLSPLLQPQDIQFLAEKCNPIE